MRSVKTDLDMQYSTPNQSTDKDTEELRGAWHMFIKYAAKQTSKCHKRASQAQKATANIHLVANFSDQFVAYCSQFSILSRLQRHRQ